VCCTCGSREWKLRVQYSSIRLECQNCGGTLRLSAATMDDLEDLCSKTELVIQGEGQ
jgi:translation initiation factor 2 beta subunit (eIF-2beta)/eIF-5